MMNTKVRALVHSTNTIRVVTLIEKVGDNKYVVITDSGVLCTAIFNPFTNFIMQMTFMEKLRRTKDLCMMYSIL